jgi:hypothetical protein
MSFGPIGIDHEAGIKHAAIGNAAAAERRDGGPHDLRQRPLDQRVGKNRGRGYRPHAAGIRAFVAVEGALVVLRRAERQDCRSVAKRKEARLLAIEEFLDHDRAGFVGSEGRVDRGERTRAVRGDRHALSRGKSVRP